MEIPKDSCIIIKKQIDVFVKRYISEQRLSTNEGFLFYFRDKHIFLYERSDYGVSIFITTRNINHISIIYYISYLDWRCYSYNTVWRCYSMYIFNSMDNQENVQKEKIMIRPHFRVFSFREKYILYYERKTNGG